MNDKVFYTGAAVIALLMIGLSLVWPQGLGVRSPEPFGHEVVLPDVVRAQREKAERDARRKAEQAAERAAKAQAAAEASAASASAQ
ncbi:hypothetical protein [Asticcacaulis sp. AND118]|uniref:hypothetical protein n=1 Tax=Asticcacaulis sp. AND118 TaxID=2840468 RepID=UPI001CFFC224|nr:hypothetical protein [Asticcacaulis sp. AND118]UDF05413.1 hypothetical protein LH365_14490 [Asticcacaulis sp. AND118]